MVIFGLLKIFNFPFVPNGKLMVFRCSSIKAHSGIHIKFPTFMDIVISKSMLLPSESHDCG